MTLDGSTVSVRKMPSRSYRRQRPPVQSWRRAEEEQSAAAVEEEGAASHDDGGGGGEAEAPVDAEDTAPTPAKSRSNKRPLAEERTLPTAATVNLPLGSVVWAKMKGFPAWPASIADPPNISGMYPEGQTYVHFYGSENNAWVSSEAVWPFEERFELGGVKPSKRSLQKPYIIAVEAANQVYAARAIKAAEQPAETVEEPMSELCVPCDAAFNDDDDDEDDDGDPIVDDRLCEELDEGEGGCDGCRLPAFHAGAHQIRQRRRRGHSQIAAQEAPVAPPPPPPVHIDEATLRLKLCAVQTASMLNESAPDSSTVSLDAPLQVGEGEGGGEEGGGCCARGRKGDA